MIVTVADVRGPHTAGEVQRAARETWAQLVRCYEQHANRQRGRLVVELKISAVGRVRSVRRINSSLGEALSRCVGQALKKKAMPVASGSSSAVVEVRLAPGDAPTG